MLVPFFPPMGGGGVQRPLSFVSHLPARGWRTTVVTPSPDAYWIRDDDLAEGLPAESRVIRTRTWSAQAFRARGRGGLRDAPAAGR